MTCTVRPYNETDRLCAFKVTSFSLTNQLKQAAVLSCFYKHTRHSVSAVCLMKNSERDHTNKYDFTAVELALLITNYIAGDSRGVKCKGWLWTWLRVRQDMYLIRPKGGGMLHQNFLITAHFHTLEIPQNTKNAFVKRLPMTLFI
jgi:hypothetical protein